MMYRLVPVFLIISIQFTFAQINQPTEILIDSSYTKSAAKPFLLLSGSKVTVEADSIYLVNKPRLKFYEDLRSHLLNWDFDCEPTYKLFRETLKNNLILADQLNENFSDIDTLNARFMLETKSLLENNRVELSKAAENLLLANKNLDLVKEELNRIQFTAFWDKVIYALAGLGAGIIVGLSLN